MERFGEMVEKRMERREGTKMERSRAGCGARQVAALILR